MSKENRRHSSVNELFLKMTSSAEAINPAQLKARMASLLTTEDVIRRHDTDRSPSPTRSHSADDYSYSSTLCTTNSMKSIERGRLRFMILEIKKHAIRNLPPPEFVPNIDDVSYNISTWKKATKSEKDRKGRPTKYVIGCQQPIDVILAMADERARKQQQVVQLKQKACEEKNRYLNLLLASKQTRGQKFSFHIDQKIQQQFWSKMIKIIKFLKRVKPIYKFMLKSGHPRNNLSGNLGEIIVRRMRLWHAASKSKKFISFLSKIVNYQWRFILHIRIRRKRKAAETIRTFLTEASDNEKKRSRVRRFIKSVHIIQKIGRDFVACKYNRISALTMILDRIDRRYVRELLRKRKDNKWLNNRQSLSEIRLDNKIMVEMNKQDRNWEATNTRMETILEVHRKSGTLTSISEEGDVERHLVPFHCKFAAIKTLIEKKRQEHILVQREASNKVMAKLQFDTLDASAMLKGNDGGLLVTTLKMLKPKRSVQIEPFILFKHISTSSLLDIVIYEHNRLQTFVVKTSSSAPSSAPPLAAPNTRTKDGAVNNSNTKDEPSFSSSTLNHKKSKNIKPKLLG